MKMHYGLKTEISSFFISVFAVLANFCCEGHAFGVNSNPHSSSHPSLFSSSSYSPTNISATASTHSYHASNSRFSTLLPKFRLHDDSLSQQAQSGTSNLHNLLLKLKRMATAQGISLNANANTGTKVVSGKLLGVNKIASNIPTYITSNTRLKRQLEGIFHVRGPSIATTPTTTTKRPNPIHNNVTTQTQPSSLSLPKRTIRYNRPPPNGSVVRRLRTFGHGSNNVHNGATPISISPKKEIGQNHHKNKENEKITSVSNFHSKKSNNHKAEDSDDVPFSPDTKGKRNFTVEIVEISRKTVIKEDNNNSGKYLPTFRPLPNNKPIDNVNSNTNSPHITQGDLSNTNSKIQIKPFRPRLRIKSFSNSHKPLSVKDSSSSASHSQQKKPYIPSVKYKFTSNNDLVASSTTAHPISANPEFTVNINPSISRNKPEAVEVQVNYQEQIPYNDRDVDEADLKDYLDGHSTFGAKGDFKHTVSRNVTGYIPNSQDNTKSRKNGQTAGPQRRSRSQGATNEVEVEQVKVKQRVQNNPKATVYTATGVPVIAMDDEDKSIFQYSGMTNNKDKPHHFPKLPKSTLDALYQQGHPAIAKAPPGPVYRGHPLSEPAREEQDEYNPFRANPLVDDPPLKYDPESDRFYGNPVPDKDKLAQSNRPEPVQIESDDRGPEYQEEERRKQPPPPPPQSQRRSDNENVNNEDDGHKVYYQRVYEPPEEDYNERNVENDQEGFIKDFVSLDNNFQALPRPTAEEEAFKDLIAPEAVDENDERLFERDNRRQNSRRDHREGPSTTRSNDGNGRTSSNPNNNDDDDYTEVYDDEPEDFDQSYVDALKQFDDEIKKIQDSERNGLYENPPPTSTGEPLVITSPGPAVSYQQQRNAPQPPQNEVTTQTHQHQDDNADENEEEEQPSQRPRPTDREQERDDGRTTTSRRGGGNENEDEEEEEEREGDDQGNEERETTTASKEEKEEDSEDKPKDADESQHVKINKVVEVKSDGLKEDKSGNLDEDISKIEEEFRRPPQSAFG